MNENVILEQLFRDKKNQQKNIFKKSNTHKIIKYRKKKPKLLVAASVSNLKESINPF